MICLKRERLKQLAAHRAQGWAPAWERLAIEIDGRLCITHEEVDRLRRDFGPASANKVPAQGDCGWRIGDAIERVAKPVARAIDWVTARWPRRWRTRLAGCAACRRRRAWLNTKPGAWWGRIVGGISGTLRRP